MPTVSATTSCLSTVTCVCPSSLMGAFSAATAATLMLSTTSCAVIAPRCRVGITFSVCIAPASVRARFTSSL